MRSVVPRLHLFELETDQLFRACFPHARGSSAPPDHRRHGGPDQRRLDRRQAAATGESGSGYVRMVGGLDGTRDQLDGFSIPEPAPTSPGPRVAAGDAVLTDGPNYAERGAGLPARRVDRGGGRWLAGDVTPNSPATWAMVSSPASYMPRVSRGATSSRATDPRDTLWPHPRPEPGPQLSPSAYQLVHDGDPLCLPLCDSGVSGQTSDRSPVRTASCRIRLPHQERAAAESPRANESGRS